MLYIFFLGLLVRLYNFPNRVVFGLEQGITLQTTHNYLQSFSLLGLENVQRFTSQGHQIYSGPLYNYFLAPFMLLTNNPLYLTYVALGINLLTGFLMYFLIKKISSKKVAIYSTLFFLFSTTMIRQSLTLWILNPLPLIGLLGMYLLHQKLKPWVVFALGILSGISVSLEWLCVVTVVIVLGYVLYKSKHRGKDLGLFTLGALIPLSPTILFDLRNDFYHFRTLYQYLLDTMGNPGQSKFQIYHLFHLFPWFFYLMGTVVSKLKYRRMICLIYILLSLRSFGTPEITTPRLLEIGEVINQEAKPGYNIVYLPESEYRAYALRYILTVMHNNPPLGVTEYPNSSELYVVSTGQADIPWEISSFNPKSSEILTPFLTRLTK